MHLKNIIPIILSTLIISIHTSLIPTIAISTQASMESHTKFSMLSSEDDFQDDTVLIVIDPEYSLEDPEIFTPEFLGLANIKSIEPLFEETRLAIINGEAHLSDLQQFTQILQITLRSPSKDNVLSMIDLAKNSQIIAGASPSIMLQYNIPIPEISNTQDYTPAASGFPYNYPGIGTRNYYYPYEDTNLYSAWNVTAGSYDVKVGIIDSGCAVLSDIMQNLTSGQDFYNTSENSKYITKDDYCSHGTAIASIIGAVGDNGIGIAGIANNVTMIPLQVTDEEEFLDAAATCRAINYANSNKIPILNFSAGSMKFDYALYTAISNYYGIFVAASGNESKNNDVSPTYPAAFDLANIISVGGWNSSGQCIYNYGTSSVDIAAPASRLAVIDNTGSVVLASGTSFAAPMVAATAALLLSAEPSLSAQQIKQAILNGASKKQSLVNKISNGRLLDIYGALRQIVPEPDPNPNVPILPQSITLLNNPKKNMTTALLQSTQYSIPMQYGNFTLSFTLDSNNTSVTMNFLDKYKQVVNSQQASVLRTEVGDINGDSLVNINDALAIFKYIASVDNNVIFDLSLADMDNDSGITVNDAIEIFRKML